MSEINIGIMPLKDKQLKRLHEAHIKGVRGLVYKNGEVTVNHENESLSPSEIQEIKDSINSIPDDLDDKTKRSNEIKNKKVLSLEEVTEVLKSRGLI